METAHSDTFRCVSTGSPCISATNWRRFFMNTFTRLHLPSGRWFAFSSNANLVISSRKVWRNLRLWACADAVHCLLQNFLFLTLKHANCLQNFHDAYDNTSQEKPNNFWFRESIENSYFSSSFPCDGMKHRNYITVGRYFCDKNYSEAVFDFRSWVAASLYLLIRLMRWESKQHVHGCAINGQ